MAAKLHENREEGILMTLKGITRAFVLREYKKTKQLNPDVTTTTVALEIAGGYPSGYATPEYNKVIQILNKLREKGEI